jgi:hypothetical protein
MLSLVRLRQAAADLSASSSLPTAHGAIARSIANVKLQPAGHRPLQMPGGPQPDWWSNGFSQTETVLPGFGASALDRLFSPFRVYEASADADQRCVQLISAVRANGKPYLLIGELVVATSSGRPSGHGNLKVTCVQLAEPGSQARDALRVIAASLTESSFAAKDPDGRPPAFAVVGKLSADEVAGLRCDLWCRGLKLDVVLTDPSARPGRTRKALDGFAGGHVLVAHARCGKSLGEVLAAVPDATRVDLTEDDSADLGLEWRLWLEDAGIDILGPDQAVSPPPPPAEDADDRTWADVSAAVAGRVCSSFVLTDRAVKQLGNNHYPKPRRMGDHLNTLANVAEAWAKLKGVVGGEFADWAMREHGLNIALHDETLVARKLHEFVLDGVTYSRVPHVRVDHAVAFTDCGRIYFARDSDNLRFIVDHIGLHPYKKKGW